MKDNSSKSQSEWWWWHVTKTTSHGPLDTCFESLNVNESDALSYFALTLFYTLHPGVRMSKEK